MAAESMIGMLVFFWRFSKWVGGEGKCFLSSPSTYKKMKAMKSKVSCNVPFRGTNEMQLPYSQKTQALKQALGRPSLPLLQELSIQQHTWHYRYHGDSSPFAFLDLGVETGSGHIWVFMFFLGFGKRKGAERERILSRLSRCLGHSLLSLCN